MVAEFESDLIRLRTREGMQVARAKGRLRGKQLKPNQAKHLLELYDLGTYSVAELAELFGVGRSTVYRTVERPRPIRPDPERPFAHLVIRSRQLNPDASFRHGLKARSLGSSSSTERTQGDRPRVGTGDVPGPTVVRARPARDRCKAGSDAARVTRTVWMGFAWRGPR